MVLYTCSLTKWNLKNYEKTKTYFLQSVTLTNILVFLYFLIYNYTAIHWCFELAKSITLNVLKIFLFFRKFKRFLPKYLKSPTTKFRFNTKKFLMKLLFFNILTTFDFYINYIIVLKNMATPISQGSSV